MSKEFDYTKLKHVTSVDQSDRQVPYNLRQSGPTKAQSGGHSDDANGSSEKATKN